MLGGAGKVPVAELEATCCMVGAAPARGAPGLAARPGEQGWPRTIARLEHFLDRWPGYGAAEDKLDAALGTDDLNEAGRLLAHLTHQFS
jgi:hypothetical protein